MILFLMEDNLQYIRKQSCLYFAIILIKLSYHILIEYVIRNNTIPFSCNNYYLHILVDHDPFTARPPPLDQSYRIISKKINCRMVCMEYNVKYIDGLYGFFVHISIMLYHFQNFFSYILVQNIFSNQMKVINRKYKSHSLIESAPYNYKYMEYLICV